MGFQIPPSLNQDQFYKEKLPNSILFHSMKRTLPKFYGVHPLLNSNAHCKIMQVYLFHLIFCIFFKPLRIIINLT
ncbi:hypothetical protein Hanom_Chr09g00791501 [Helianthus anomalus]